MKIIKCQNCARSEEHHAKGLCITCYKKLAWKPLNVICKRCRRQMPHHSQGFCPGCYNFVFHLDKSRDHSARLKFGLDLDQYKKLNHSCVICGWDKFTSLHHLDENKKNNSPENLICLCPNHNKMISSLNYRRQIYDLLKEKGVKIPQNLDSDFQK